MQFIILLIPSTLSSELFKMTTSEKVNNALYYSQYRIFTTQHFHYNTLNISYVLFREPRGLIRKLVDKSLISGLKHRFFNKCLIPHHSLLWAPYSLSKFLNAQLRSQHLKQWKKITQYIVVLPKIKSSRNHRSQRHIT